MNPSGDDRTPRPADANSSSPKDSSEELDFDDSANALWSLYRREAEGHDKATIKTLKDDMDGLLIFVCSHISILSCP